MITWFERQRFNGFLVRDSHSMKKQILSPSDSYRGKRNDTSDVVGFQSPRDGCHDEQVRWHVGEVMQEE